MCKKLSTVMHLQLHTPMILYKYKRNTLRHSCAKIYDNRTNRK